MHTLAQRVLSAAESHLSPGQPGKAGHTGGMLAWGFLVFNKILKQGLTVLKLLDSNDPPTSVSQVAETKVCDTVQGLRCGFLQC